MIGTAMAMDLARRPGFAVTVADLRPDVLARIAARYGVATLQADLSDPGIVASIAARFDMVLGALPSRFGLQTLRAVIEAGRNYCDISFMPEDALVLDGLARERGVTAVVDCGVAPGMSNLLAGWAASRLDPCERIDIVVGGLPVIRQKPFEYKAPFAPYDVIEEYTRPARMVEGGRVVIREALSGVEPIDLPGIGTLEAFNTDGLRSLITTLPQVPTMTERTLRYPGHADLMRAFRTAGLFSQEPITVAGQTLRPFDLTARLLFPLWTYEEGEADLTVMRVLAEGQEGGHQVRYEWTLFDRYDPETGLRSMSRTTAFPATIVAGLIASGRFRRPGVHPPEVLGREPGLPETILEQLAERGVRYTATVTRC